MQNRIRSVVYILLAGGLMASSATAGVITKLPHVFGDGYKLIETVGDTKSNSFDLFHPVKNMGKKYQDIGKMSTEFQLYNGTHGKVSDGAKDGTGGAWADYVKKLPDKVQLEKNWSFAFLQVVAAETDPGVQPWGAKKGEWFMDTGNVTDDPRYAKLDGDADAFNDYPDRTLSTDEVWKAEMSLALINMTDKKVEFIGAFVWGFRIKAGVVTTEGTSYGAPLAWGPVTDTLKSTFKKDWKKANGDDIPDFHDWTIVDIAKSDPQGLVMLVPSPATLVLAGLGGLLAGRRRRAIA